MKLPCSKFGVLGYGRKGQSLIEILIGSAVGVIMVIGALSVIVPSLSSNASAGRVQAGTALAKELSENVRVWSEADWHNIYGLSTGSGSHYYLNAASSPFASSTGNETVLLNGVTYTRYFYVDAVGRAGGGGIPGGTDDPSTRQITVSVSWPQSSNPVSMVFYLTRSRNFILRQTDWSGGPGQNGPVTSPNSKFSNASDTNYLAVPGSLKINF